MTGQPSLLRRPWFWAALALTAFKLWLTRGQGVYAIGDAGLDDRLFIDLAQHLLRGDWLGPYNELTLAKGPFYPLFIAAAFSVGLPLFFAQQLLYAAASALFARALRPAITSGWWRLAIFTLLLWNPMSFEAASMGRVLRQHVYGPLALMIFAGLVALYLRRTRTVRHQAPWAVLLGLAAAAFYLTREEVVWLAPSVVLLAGAALLSAGKDSRATLRRTTGLLGLAAGVAAIPVLLVCAENQKHYRWFGTCEFRAADFRDAYGAMLRVRVGPELPYVPVPRQAREAMAAASPAFAELQRQLDAGIATGWAGASELLTHQPAAQGQIGGGWMMWAFREAAARTGHCANARLALRYYRQLADEINRACDEGRLPAGPARSGFLPPARAARTAPLLRTAVVFSDFVVRYSRFSARPPFSTGSPEDLQLFRDVTRERLSPPDGELDVVGADEYLLNLWKVGALQAIGKTLRPVLTGLFYLAQVLALIRVVQAIRRRQWTFPLTVAAAAWGAGMASILMHAMIEVTSFPVLTVSSFAPIYPLVLVFVIATLWDAIAAWRTPPQTPGAGTAGRPAVPAQSVPPPEPAVAASWALPCLAGLAALVPFVVWQHQFRELFWFGDDLFLLDQMAAMGLRDWSIHVFSENFVPLFKVLWGGSAMVFGGSYAAMLWLLWLTHALNTLVLGRLLLRAGFPWFAALATQFVFALTPANLESLGWSVQWSAVLATSFLLIALWWQGEYAGTASVRSWRLLVPLVLLSAASACSFSRGVLTGPVLALGFLLPALLAGNWRAAARSWTTVLPVLLPAVAVALTIIIFSSGNHQQMSGHWGEAVAFGAGYLLLNPGHSVFGETSLHPIVLILLGAAKVGIVAGALSLARGRSRHLLLLLLAYDLGNAVLLGIGRYHTGFLAMTSSRYQYSSLLATLPSLFLLVAAPLARLPRRVPRVAVSVCALGLLAGLLLLGWPAALGEFVPWRGTELRGLIFAPATNDPEARVPALDFMHIERAKALQRAYGLH